MRRTTVVVRTRRVSRRAATALAVSVLALLFMAASSQATAVVFEDSVQQGFSCPVTSQQNVAYLYALQVSTVTLKPDITVCQPPTTTRLTAVGVISSVHWGGAPSESIFITAFVSTSNHAVLEQLLHSTLSSTAVSFDFNVFSFDQVTKTWFDSFQTGIGTSPEALSGSIAKNGTTLQLATSTESDASVRIPTNYQVNLAVAPTASAKTLLLRSSSTTAVAKPWGVTLGSAPPSEAQCVEPRLAKLSEKAARQRLAKNNCGIKVLHVHGNGTRGHVLRAEGKPGKKYPAGHKVKVYIES